MRRLRPGVVGLACVLLWPTACQREVAVEPQPLVAATVNGEPVYAHQIERELLRYEVPESHSPQRVELAASVLDKLVLEKVLLAEADMQGVQVAQEEVHEVMEQMARGYRSREFHQMLHHTYLTPGLLQERVRDRLRIERLVESRVSQVEAISDDDLRQFYDETTERFRVPEQVRVRQILVRTREQAEQLRERLRRKESFEELARAHSLAPEAQRGGDLGYFGRGVMPPIFDDLCFNQETDAVSDVVASDYGYHLFKVVDRRSEELIAFEDAKGDIRRELAAQRRRAAAAAFFEELMGRASIVRDVDVLAQIAGKEEDPS